MEWSENYSSIRNILQEGFQDWEAENSLEDH